MDTLPLNGNHANNYSMASSEYLSDCVQILDRSGGYSNHKETTLEKKILKELTSNYIPSYLNNHERATTERNHNLMNKQINSSMANGGDWFTFLSCNVKQSLIKSHKIHIYSRWPHLQQSCPQTNIYIHLQTKVLENQVIRKY